MKPLRRWTIAFSFFQLASGPTFNDLANFTYHFGPEDKRTVVLADGKGKDADESAFELMKLHAVGDLDGDKQPDAAAMLVESSGGSGHFYYLFVLLNKGGKLVQIEQPEWLGDRSVIQRVTINRACLPFASSHTRTKTRRAARRGRSKTDTVSRVENSSGSTNRALA